MNRPAADPPPETSPAPRRTSGVIVPLIAAAGLLGLGGYAFWSTTQSGPGGAGGAPGVAAAAPEGCITGGLDQVGGPIDLVDKNGRAVRDADLRGAPSIVYFGFTFCPDICGPSLYTMGDAVRALGPDFGPIQPVFISLDPERDTTDVIDAYIDTPGFAEGLIGLTGSVETGTMDRPGAAAAAFRVSAQRQPQEGGDYTINHTSFLYILDPEWRVRGMISTLGPPDETGAFVSAVSGEQVAACVRYALSVAE